MKILVVIFSLFLIVSTAQAVIFTFENDTNERCTFLLYWHDHKLGDYPYPANVYGSSHEPHKIAGSKYDYPGRLFTILIHQGEKEIYDMVIIKEDTKYVYYIWDGITLNYEETK